MSDMGTPREMALLVVDVQRDFCPGGALPAARCPGILEALNRHLRAAAARGVAIYASRDWHPAETTHFAAFGGPWPPHCVQDTPGAEFHPDLLLPRGTVVVSKGMDPAHPGYSAFDGRTPLGRPLEDDLRARGVHALYLMGLTTEYCVKQTALDALRAGFRVTVLTDAIAGIDAKPGDADRALADIAAAGAALDTAITTRGAD
jgi:nicotinamidase/pyrazinamidase